MFNRQISAGQGRKRNVHEMSELHVSQVSVFKFY